MRLAFNLAPCIPGITTLRYLFESILKDSVGGDASYFITRFERQAYLGGVAEEEGLAACPTILATTAKSPLTLKAVLNWFRLVLAALDCYTWAIGQDLLTPVLVFSNAKGNKKRESVLFRVVGHFYSDVAEATISTLAAGVTFSPRESDEFNREKCTVLVRSVNFLCVILDRHSSADVDRIVPDAFWTSRFWNVVVSIIVEPTTLGFNMTDIEVMSCLPEQTASLLKCLKKHRRLSHGFSEVLSRRVAKLNLEDSLRSLSTAETGKLRFVSRAYEQLYLAGFLTDAMHQSDLSSFLLKIVHRFTAGHDDIKTDGTLSSIGLSPEWYDLANQLLQLAFAMRTSIEDLVALMLPEQGSRSTQFYATFNKIINGHLVANAEDALAALLKRVRATKDINLFAIVTSTLCSMLDSVNQDSALRRKYAASLAGAVLARWSEFDRLWCGDISTQESKQLVLNLLTKLILVDSSVLKHDVFSTAVCAMYCDMLTDNATNLPFKTGVLDLLIFFVDLPDASRLKAALNAFVLNNFPMKSSDYPVGSLKHKEYVGALAKILLALELTGSSLLLGLLISVMCRESRHVCEDAIQASIVKFVRRLGTADRLKPTMDLVFGMCFDETSLTTPQRRAVIDRVGASLVRCASPSALRAFYFDHIVRIMSVADAKLTRMSEASIETQLTSKLCCYQLFEVMYIRLDKDLIHSKDSVVNRAYCGLGKTDMTGKEMTTAITKLTNAAKGEDTRGNTLCVELYRECHCAAYNALVAVISCTQTELKFYHAFLFSDNPNKGQFLWENLVDTMRKYEFSVEMEQPSTRRTKYASIFQDMRESRHANADSEDADAEASVLQSVHYLASEYLADSSLNADVSQFDFASSIASLSKQTRATSSSASQSKPRVAPASSSSLESSSHPIREQITESDSDELSQHECMPSLCNLLSHLVTRINPIVAGTDADKSVAVASGGSMPSWMENMNKKFLSADCPMNVKLFLAKLIVNCQEIFRPYAASWLTPLVKLVTSEELASGGLNSFVIDIVITVLSWHTVAVPQDNYGDRAMVGNLVRFLARNCHHDNRSVLRNNLEVLKALFEVWRASVEVPTKILFDNFNEADPKSKRNATGVQMVGVVVANRLSPFRADQDVDKDKFYQYLALNMTNDHKHVYSAAAEVIGMTLKVLADDDKGEDARAWRDCYLDNIGKTLMSRKLDQLITCVHRMQSQYPEVSDRFMSKILFMLPKVYGVYKTQCLEIVLNRVGHVDNLFLELKSKGFMDLLTIRDESTQHYALRVIHKMLIITDDRFSPEKFYGLTTDQLLCLVPSVLQFVTSASVECRLTTYAIFMSVYDKYCNAPSDEKVDEIITRTKEVLLRGLSDENESNRLSVQNFWSRSTRLPTPTVERLVTILEAMYCPDTEPQYLGYATNFLLEMTSRSPDYNRSVCEQPLADCKFVDYAVQCAWKQRHATMTPMFVETQLSQTQAGGGLGGISGGGSMVQDGVHSTVKSEGWECSGTSKATGDGDSSGPLRETQVGEHQSFEPTQMGGGGARGAYNWLTQSESLDTFAADYSATSGDGTESSLLFTVGATGNTSSRSKSYPHRPRPVASDFGKGKVGQSSTSVTNRAEKNASKGDESGDILRLKKRFYKSQQEASRVFFINRNTLINKQRDKLIDEQKQRREHQVTMYRKYRSGDLPDIQINYSYIIAPLQALAQRDTMIARLLFGALFKAVLVRLRQDRSEAEGLEVVTKINRALTTMLATSVYFCPPFIASILVSCCCVSYCVF